MPTSYENMVVDAMISYYNHDYDVFLNYLDEAVVWYGPNEGQYIVGKQNLENMLQTVNRDVRFRVENVQTRLFSFSAVVYCVIMTYTLYSIHPDGTVKEYMQRVTFNGRRCKDNNGNNFWLCPYIEVSNITQKGHGTVKETGFSHEKLNTDSRKRLFFAGDNHNTICIAESSINYIEGGKGVSSNIYTDGEVFRVHNIIKDILPKLGENFYRCHDSYVVNTDKVAGISAGKIIMNNGSTVPIPRRKIRQVTSNIEKLLEKLPSDD